MAIDANSNAFVAGQTSRADGRKGAFAAKTNADGSEVLRGKIVISLKGTRD